MAHPDSNTLFPISGWEHTCYLKNIIKSPKIIVGDYTYYDDPEDVYNFEKNVLYSFDFNALVTKDVAPYTVVGGNPAKLIRKRYSDKDIDALVNLSLAELAS